MKKWLEGKRFSLNNFGYLDEPSYWGGIKRLEKRYTKSQRLRWKIHSFTYSSVRYADLLTVTSLIFQRTSISSLIVQFFLIYCTTNSQKSCFFKSYISCLIIRNIIILIQRFPVESLHKSPSLTSVIICVNGNQIISFSYKSTISKILHLQLEGNVFIGDVFVKNLVIKKVWKVMIIIVKDYEKNVGRLWKTFPNLGALFINYLIVHVFHYVYSWIKRTMRFNSTSKW